MRAVNCWNCKDRIVLDDSFAGRRIRCDNCSALVEIDEPDTADEGEDRTKDPGAPGSS